MRRPIRSKSCSISKSAKSACLGQHPDQALEQLRNVPLPVAELRQRPALGLVGADLEDLVEGRVGRPHPQLGREHHQREAYRRDDRLGELLRLQDLPLAALALGDLGEGHDHAVDAVGRGAIRHDAADVPAAEIVDHLGIRRQQPLEHLARRIAQMAVAEALREMGDRPADVGRQQLQQRLHRRREPADAEAAIEEQRRDVGAVEQVVEIVGARLELADLGLELAVDRIELLVERLQLLLGGLELLVRGLQLLVDRPDLLVGRLQLLVRRLHLLDAEAEILAGGVELALQLVLARRLADLAGPGPLVAARLALAEAHQQPERGIAPGSERRDHYAHRMQRIAAADLGVAGGLAAFVDGLAHRHAQHRLQALARHRQQVVRGLAARRPQVVLGRSAQEEHPVVYVDQGAGRRVALDQRLIHQLADTRRRIRRGRRRQIVTAPVARADEREVHDVVTGGTQPPEDPPLLGDRPEQVLLAADRLGQDRGTGARPRAARSGTD